MSKESRTVMAEMSVVQFEDWLESQVFEQGSGTHLMFDSMWDRITESMYENAMKDALTASWIAGSRGTFMFLRKMLKQLAGKQAQEVISKLRYKTCCVIMSKSNFCNGSISRVIC